MKTLVKCLGLALLGSTMATAALADQTFSDAFAGFGANDRQPIQIESEQLQVQDKDNSAVFTGNVVVTQGENKLKTSKLTVYYVGKATEALGGGSGEPAKASAEADKPASADAGASGDGGMQQRIKKLEADGSVYISSKDQTASGDEATFDMQSRIMVMTGKQVVLSQGPNVVTGSKLTVNLATGKANLEAPHSGRVRVMLQPNSLKGE